MLHLNTLWFILLTILWVGFFVLEGFDFGVGMLHTVVGKTDTEQRVAINTIGPWWDGNEVWLIVAGAGTFAAFPGWYATMFSALYLPLLLILVALIARGVAFEFRNRDMDPAWRAAWSWCLTIGSLMIPLLLGVGLGDLLAGLPINAAHNFTGNFFDLLTPYGLWTGVTMVALCLLHGATFLSIRTTGKVHDRAQALGKPFSIVASLAVLGFVIWTLAVSSGHAVPGPVPVLSIIAVLAAAWLVRSGNDGWAFVSSAVAIASTVGSLFIAAYPVVMVSSTSPLYNLTVKGTASGGYALKVMTIVTVLLLPVVLIYQGWSFYVFRHRVIAPPAKADTPPASPPPAPPLPAAPQV